MHNGMYVSAVIVAAGKGRRMGSRMNKQYLIVDDKPVLAHTLLKFSNMDMVDNIVVVVGEDEIEYCKDSIISRYNIKKVVNVVAGGRERQHSVSNGLAALKGICDIVIIHDGARILVTEDIIEESVRRANVYEAVACAVPVKDTIKVINSENFIVDTPERSKLYAVQTPQTFRFELLYSSHLKAMEQNYIGTDDTVLVERTGTKVKLFAGSYENIKITTPEDVYIAEAIIKYRENKSFEKS